MKKKILLVKMTKTALGIRLFASYCTLKCNCMRHSSGFLILIYNNSSSRNWWKPLLVLGKFLFSLVTFLLLLLEDCFLWLFLCIVSPTHFFFFSTSFSLYTNSKFNFSTRFANYNVKDHFLLLVCIIFP